MREVKVEGAIPSSRAAPVSPATLPPARSSGHVETVLSSRRASFPIHRAAGSGAAARRVATAVAAARSDRLRLPMARRAMFTAFFVLAQRLQVLHGNAHGVVRGDRVSGHALQGCFRAVGLQPIEHPLHLLLRRRYWVWAARHHMDFLNNSRNDILILSTGAQTQSFPDDTGNRLRMCLAGVVVRGLC
jgi:hypothetical protein